MRHAEAEELGPSNLMRCLTIHGVVQAKSIGNKLRELDIGIDHILCSKALRTKQTFEALALESNPTYSDVLFMQKSLQAIIDEIKEALINAKNLLVVMHMPSILELANHYGANLDSFGKANVALFEIKDDTFTFIDTIKPQTP